MCKICENTSSSLYQHQILKYDNRRSMSVSFGQYKGVKVDSRLYLKGNMLIMGAFGSYRSDFDCYYESQGLDIDDLKGSKSPDSYIKIEYCPFCGRKLDSTLYESTKAKDDIEELKSEIDYLENELRKNQILIRFTFDEPNRHEITEEFTINGKVHTQTRWVADAIGYDNKNPIILAEIFKKYDNIQIDINLKGGDSRGYGYQNNPEYKLDTPIKLNGSGMYQFWSYIYMITEKTYRKLAEFGYIKIDEEKLSILKKEQKNIEKQIQEKKTKIQELKKYLKEL